jgi:uncharacterized OB-fold protein
MSEATRLVDDTLFMVDADVITLRGAQCAACGTTTFPYQSSCSRCSGVDLAEVALPRAGRIWSFTVQYFEPKAPYRGLEPFEPYGVGYVDLGPVIIASRLTENDAEKLAIGAPVELTSIPAFDDDTGTTVLTYAFALVGGAS